MQYTTLPLSEGDKSVCSL